MDSTTEGSGDPAKERDFLPFRSNQIYATGLFAALFPGIKRRECEADLKSPCMYRSLRMLGDTPTPQCNIQLASLVKYWENITLLWPGTFL
jgi:hypothetical protein